MSKNCILDQMPSFSKTTLSHFDTVELFIFTFAVYVGGSLGDKYDLRKLITISYILLAISCVIFSFAGFFHIENQAYFYVWWTLVGLF
jgi:MFS family permease